GSVVTTAHAQRPRRQGRKRAQAAEDRQFLEEQEGATYRADFLDYAYTGGRRRLSAPQQRKERQNDNDDQLYYDEEEYYYDEDDDLYYDDDYGEDYEDDYYNDYYDDYDYYDDDYDDDYYDDYEISQSTRNGRNRQTNDIKITNQRRPPPQLMKPNDDFSEFPLSNEVDFIHENVIHDGPSDKVQINDKETFVVK
ncbi:unnamed protein product, partial [Meganyctiphanes norvegica]